MSSTSPYRTTCTNRSTSTSSRRQGPPRRKALRIDLAAARNIAAAAKSSGRFVRCSSEFPFLPGAQRAVQVAREGGLGKVLEIRSGFHHSSDLDPTKPANWKRQVKTCGAIGVMGDLGMHTVHVPFRLAGNPSASTPSSKKIYPERPDGKGGTAPCDTWDNAMLHTEVDIDGAEVPVRFEMKRLAPARPTPGSSKSSAPTAASNSAPKEPKTLWTFKRGKEQQWQRTDLGFHGPFPTITGGIFEPGFPDCFLQMWAAYVAERAGKLDSRFGCGHAGRSRRQPRALRRRPRFPRGKARGPTLV